MFLLICSLFSNKGSAKEPMSDSGKRNISFVMIEEVLQCQILSALVIGYVHLFILGVGGYLLTRAPLKSQ